ncbi:MAG: polysaccharide biosynthesis protein [Eubacterium sp.]|nr:polysaccharide biosynthesis protein [Eubacterium sp.]
MVAGIITRIIGVLYRSPVTSIIGDEGNGYYSIAVNIYTMILLISSYSIPMAVSKVVSGKLALKQYRDAHKVFRCALLYVLIVGTIGMCVTFFGADYLISENQSHAVPALRILAPAIFISGFLGVFRGYFQAHGSMVPTSASQIIEQIINAIVSIGAAILFIRLFADNDEELIPVFGAMGSAAGIVAGVITGLVFMLLLYMANASYFKKRRMHDVSGVDSSMGSLFLVILLMVTPVILSTFVYNISTVINQTIFIDVMDFRGVDSREAASLYGVFSGKFWVLVNVPVALANSMSTAMIPAVSGSYTLGDYRKCGQKVKEAVHFTMMIAIPAAMGLFVLACPVMQVLFPQRATIRMAINILRAGAICVVFYSLSTVSNGVLQGIGKVNIPLRNAAFSLLLQVMLLASILYFTGLDLYALVAATCFYSFMMCLLNSLSVRKYLNYRQEIRKTFLIPAVSAIFMGAFCYFFYQGLYQISYHLLGSILPLRLIILVCMMIAIGCAVLVYFVSELKLGGVTEEEMKNFPKGTSLLRIA